MSEGLEGRRIGLIGCGAMARALAGGLIRSGLGREQLCAADLSESQRSEFERELGVTTRPDNDALVAESEIVVLCVKPNGVRAVLERLTERAGSSELERILWISIAAGVRLATLEAALPAGSRIVRCMPNTPALVGAGAAALCGNARVEEGDLICAEALFRAVGITWRAPSEALIDVVTGLSGSGPAFVFLVIEALADGGVRQGLPRDAAYQLAAQTVLGAAQLVLTTGRHPADLKDQVTSPGGTTIAGLERLEANAVRAAFYEAVAAATERSRELSGA